MAARGARCFVQVAGAFLDKSALEDLKKDGSNGQHTGNRMETAKPLKVGVIAVI